MPDDKAVQLFIRLHLNKQDVCSLPISYPVKILSQCRCGRIFISIFFKEKASSIVQEVVKNYQTAKLEQFSKRLSKSEALNLTKKEQKKIIFLASHSHLQGKIQIQLRKRAWKRWRNLELRREVFESAYPKNSAIWTGLLSDKEVDAYLEKAFKANGYEDEISDTEDEKIDETVSDNILSAIEIVSTGDADLDELAKSDNIEMPFQSLEHSQTVPYYLTSTENFLAFLLDSEEQATMIDHISLMAASFTMKNKNEKNAKFKKYQNIFLAWANIFAKTRKNLQIISKEQYLLDFAQFPKAKPLVPLLRYLPSIVEGYQKWRGMHAKASAEINYDALSSLLKQESTKTAKAEEEIAELLRPLINQFMDRLLDAVEDGDLRSNWLEFCKKAASDWENPFYVVLLKVTDWTPEAVIKFSLKQKISDYVPMLQAIQRRVQLLHKYAQELNADTDKLIKKEEKAIAKLQAQLKLLRNEELEKEIKLSEEYITLLKEYKDQIEASKQEGLKECAEQIKWESTKEAKSLDLQVAKIHKEIWKEVLCAWVDKHSLKPWITCLGTYRQIILSLKELFEHKDPLAEKNRVTAIHELVVDLIIQAIKAAQQYATEVPEQSIEKTIFSSIDAHLQTVSYEADSLNITFPTWQQLFAPMLEDLLNVPGVF